MSMKTILVPTENDDAMRSALETALLLAQRCDAYIEGFALRGGVSEIVAVDAIGGFPLEPYRQDIADQAMQAQQIFESFMQEHYVPRATGATVSLSFGWLDDAPEGDDFVGSYGRVFDLIVMNRSDANSTSLHNRAIETGLFESGRPILLSPLSPPRQIATNVLIAWNRSTEQTRATAFAMPLIRLADRVTVLTVMGGTGVPGPSAEQLIRYLQRNGIVAQPLSVELDGRTTGEMILATAQSLGCDLLIKGLHAEPIETNDIWRRNPTRLGKCRLARFVGALSAWSATQVRKARVHRDPARSSTDQICCDAQQRHSGSSVILSRLGFGRPSCDGASS